MAILCLPGEDIQRKQAVSGLTIRQRSKASGRSGHRRLIASQLGRWGYLTDGSGERGRFFAGAFVLLSFAAFRQTSRLPQVGCCRVDR